MSYRAAIILVETERVALIERRRAGQHYFTFPGGHVEAGEQPEQAAVRETLEELGLQVKVIRLLGKMGWHGGWQYYYLVENVGGTFGSGTGEEMLHPRPERGTYHPTWLAVDELATQPVLPREMAVLVSGWVRAGWPEEPVAIPEKNESK